MMQVRKPAWLSTWCGSSPCIRRDCWLPFQVGLISSFWIIFESSSFPYYLSLSTAWRRTTLVMTWNTCSSDPRAPWASSPGSPSPAQPGPGEYLPAKNPEKSLMIGFYVIEMRWKPLIMVRSVNLAFLSLPDFPSVLDTFRECKVSHKAIYVWPNIITSNISPQKYNVWLACSNQFKNWGCKFYVYSLPISHCIGIDSAFR